MTSPIWCADSSREVGEQMIGSAVEANRWLLIEYNQTWEPQALPQSDLPLEVRGRLVELEASIEGLRVQFIKQNRLTHSGTYTVFVADTDDINNQLYRLEITDYVELIELDIMAYLAGRMPAASYHEPLFLVCTHGKRDLCCARYGFLAYQELLTLQPDLTWQTTHLGGHRFAANILCLPSGIMYGWAEGQSKHIVDQTLQKQIVLEHLRGRCAYPRVAQAAEYFLRMQSGKLDFDDYQLVDVKNVDDQRSQVSFVERDTGDSHIMVIETYPSEFLVYKSSGDTTPVTVPQFRLLPQQTQ